MVSNSLWVYGDGLPEVAMAFTEAKFRAKVHKQIPVLYCWFGVIIRDIECSNISRIQLFDTIAMSPEIHYIFVFSIPQATFVK